MESKERRRLRKEYYHRINMINSTHQTVLSKLREDYIKATTANDESRREQLASLREKNQEATKGVKQDAANKIPVS